MTSYAKGTQYGYLMNQGFNSNPPWYVLRPMVSIPMRKHITQHVSMPVADEVMNQVFGQLDWTLTWSRHD